MPPCLLPGTLCMLRCASHYSDVMIYAMSTQPGLTSLKAFKQMYSEGSRKLVYALAVISGQYPTCSEISPRYMKRCQYLPEVRHRWFIFVPAVPEILCPTSLNQGFDDFPRVTYTDCNQTNCLIPSVLNAYSREKPLHLLIIFFINCIFTSSLKQHLFQRKYRSCWHHYTQYNIPTQRDVLKYPSANQPSSDIQVRE